MRGGPVGLCRGRGGRMFVGHFGVGLGLKRWAPVVSLGTLFLAAQWVDLLWPTLLVLGVEQVEIEPGITRMAPLDFVHYPYTHSLVAALVWAGLFALIYGLLTRSRRLAVICAIGVASHWGLDLLVHRPDLPLVPGGGPMLGLGGWNSVWATVVLEFAFFGGGLWLYLKSTTARDGVGKWGLVGLVVFLLVIEVGNLAGPPPPSVSAIAVMGHAQWLLVLWGWWVDRHRSARLREAPLTTSSAGQPG